MNARTLIFLNIWSLTISAEVAAASYIIAKRLTVEYASKLAMLKALGAKTPNLRNPFEFQEGIWRPFRVLPFHPNSIELSSGEY